MKDVPTKDARNCDEMKHVPVLVTVQLFFFLEDTALLYFLLFYFFYKTEHLSFGRCIFVFAS